MALTLGDAIKVFRRELGCSGDDGYEDLLDSVNNGIEHVLVNGGGRILREWRILARQGRFTFPRDLETPLKWKYHRLPNYGYGSFYPPQHSYSSQGVHSCCGFWDWDNRLEVRANKTPVEFQPPSTGVRLLATTRDSRDVGRKMMVIGKRCGKEIAPLHNGVKTAGEVITVYHEDDTNKKYGAWIFDEITGVVRDTTCAYSMLSGIDSTGEFYFLSHYHPDEETPLYTEGDLFGCGITCDVVLHILGRVNPYMRYVREDEIIPITSSEIIRLLAKRARYDDAGNYAEVAAIETRIKILIKRQVAYKQEPNRHLSFSLKSGGATQTNM